MLGLGIGPFGTGLPFGHVSAIPVVSEHPAMLGGKLADAVQEKPMISGSYSCHASVAVGP